MLFRPPAFRKRPPPVCLFCTQPATVDLQIGSWGVWVCRDHVDQALDVYLTEGEKK